MRKTGKLLDISFPCVLTQTILDECNRFTCGDDDMDEFFYNEAVDYIKFHMGKSYCFRLLDDPKVIIACFTVSNDSIRIFDLGSSRKNRMWKEVSNREKLLSRYPGVLIGRLAVSVDFSGQGIGSDVVRFIKEWFVDDDNKSGCRLAIVDARNSDGVLAFYEKNSFRFLFRTEDDEYNYMHMHDKEHERARTDRLNTRLMYCDLLSD